MSAILSGRTFWPRKIQKPEEEKSSTLAAAKITASIRLLLLSTTRSLTFRPETAKRATLWPISPKPKNCSAGSRESILKRELKIVERRFKIKAAFESGFLIALVDNFLFLGFECGI